MARDWYWWLVTWGTYGSWLPGDERGFRTWRKREYVPPPARYAGPDEATYDPRAFRERRRRSHELADGAIQLDEEDQRIAVDAVVTDVAELPIEPKIMAVTEMHVHLLAIFGEAGIRQTVGRQKSRATRALKRNRGFVPTKRMWAKGGHMESLETEDDQLAAYEYVRKHESQGIVYSWTSLSQADGSAVER